MVYALSKVNKDASFLSKLYFIYFPLIPVIIEFVLSLKDFSSRAIKYFIIRFISQILLYYLISIIYEFNIINIKFNEPMEKSMAKMCVKAIIILIPIFELLSYIIIKFFTNIFLIEFQLHIIVILEYYY